MSALVGLLLLIPICSAFDPSQLSFLNHSLSSTVHPCDDFDEFVCNTQEYDGLSPALADSFQPFNVALQEAFLSDNDPIAELLMPLLLVEREKNETLKEIGKQRAFEAMKNERDDLIMYHYPDYMVVKFVNRTTITSRYASMHPLIQGFVDGFFVNATQFGQSELEYITVSMLKGQTVESHFNITSDSSIEKQREVGRELGLRTPAYHREQKVPLVYYEGKSIMINLDLTYTQYWVPFKDSHPLSQGAVEAFIEHHTELNTTLQDIDSIVNILDTKEVKKLEDSVAAELKKTKPLKLSLLDDIINHDKTLAKSVNPFIKYMKILTAKYALEKNLIPKEVKNLLRQVFDDVKSVVISTNEETNWYQFEDRKRRAIDKLSDMQLVPELPEKLKGFPNGVVRSIRDDFAARMAKSPVTENCDNSCTIKHYMDLLQKSYYHYVDWVIELLPYVHFNIVDCSVATFDVYRDTLIPSPLISADLPEALLYASYGPSFATFLLDSLAKIASEKEETDGLRYFTFNTPDSEEACKRGKPMASKDLMRVQSINVAWMALLDRTQKTRGDRGHAEADIKMFFYGLHVGRCFGKPDTLKDPRYGTSSEFKKAFKCQPGQKMMDL
ncbi:hypothetical protein QR680_018637 [Steinernema hermaphroditum]|uniref:Peptidase M13 N-terminal domain-containing protein n=1 Tax=Steinernema hermaphroditum TaxID=289476 RepID=A0AA39HJG1_9BILA|nr:hypothetical protein QR680_018637 [Steinernema hermaphroditum]